MFARQGSAIIPEAITHVKRRMGKFKLFYEIFSVADQRLCVQSCISPLWGSVRSAPAHTLYLAMGPIALNIALYTRLVILDKGDRSFRIPTG